MRVRLGVGGGDVEELWEDGMGWIFDFGVVCLVSGVIVGIRVRGGVGQGSRIWESFVWGGRGGRGLC